MFAELIALALAAAPYRSAQEADADAVRSRGAATQATQCMGAAVNRNAANNQEAGKEVQEISALLKQKRQAISELAQGYYCSQCGRTASEIERAERISFSQHLANVKGRPIPAPASRIRQKSAEYDQKINNAKAKLQRYRDAWENLKAEWSTCRSQRDASYQREAVAKAWARHLAAQEKQRAAMEAARRLAEAREKARREREEAARLAHERLLRDVERQAAVLMKQWAEEQAAQRKRQAALDAELATAQSAFQAGLTDAASTTGQLTGTAAPAATTPAAEPLKPDEAAYARASLDGTARSILDKSTWSEPHENTVFPTPAQPDQQQTQTLYQRIADDVTQDPMRADGSPTDERSALARTWDNTRERLRALSPQLTPESDPDDGSQGRKGLRDRLADGYRAFTNGVQEKRAALAEKKTELLNNANDTMRSWLKLPSEEQLAQMDPAERHIRSFWRVLAIHVLPGRTVNTPAAIYRYNEEGMKLVDKEIQEVTGPPADSSGDPP